MYNSLLKTKLSLSETDIVSAWEVQEIVNVLPTGKAPGIDKLVGEHFKYCDTYL